MHKEDVAITNMYATKTRVSKIHEENPIKLKEEIDNSKIIVGDVHTSLSMIDKTIKQKNARLV